MVVWPAPEQICPRSLIRDVSVVTSHTRPSRLLMLQHKKTGDKTTVDHEIFIVKKIRTSRYLRKFNV